MTRFSSVMMFTNHFFRRAKMDGLTSFSLLRVCSFFVAVCRTHCRGSPHLFFLLAIRLLREYALLRFAMNCMFIAELAKLVQLQLFRRMHLILFCIVVTLLTFRTGKRNSLSCTRFCHGGSLRCFMYRDNLSAQKKRLPRLTSIMYSNTKRESVSNIYFPCRRLPDDSTILRFADGASQDNFGRFDQKIESVGRHVVEFLYAEKCREIAHHRNTCLKRRLTIVASLVVRKTSSRHGRSRRVPYPRRRQT